MSSSLTTIQTQLNFYIYSTFIIFGNIGNILIIMIFKNKYHNPCAIYILSAAIVNDLYLTLIGFFQMFPFYYEDASTRAFILCKFRYYISNTIGQIARSMLILACIDRFLITSDRTSFRAFSTTKRSKWFILSSIILWTILASHIAIWYTIQSGKCNTFGTYTTVYSLYLVIFVCLMPPVILSIFGYLTYRNIRRVHLRIQPLPQDTTKTNARIRRQDRDLIIIVFAEIVVYVLTNIPYALVFLEILISQYVVPKKSVQYSQIESFIRNMSTILLFVNNSAPFYMFFISSKSFRLDVKHLFIESYRKLT